MKNRRGSQKNITAELENGKILLLIVWLSIPAVIAQLITFLYNIVDRMYVARMDGDGMDALAAVINIVLDPIFIFRLEMGVRGSSLATVLSQFCSCLCVPVFLYKKEPVPLPYPAPLLPFSSVLSPGPSRLPCRRCTHIFSQPAKK